MSGVFGYSREAVRVKVKKCEGNQQPEWRKFSVDPQITSFEVLQSILAKAFDLKGEFTICFRVYDVNGHETYMPLLSDWDLDAAFLKAHNTSVATNSEACLCLRVDLRPFEECSDDWEIKQNVPILTQIRTATSQEAKPSPRLHGIFNQMGKTLNMVQRAFNFGEDETPFQPPRPPLSDAEFRRFLDAVGQIVYAKELRSVIYFGGIDPSLRKVVWKHLLNVYPEGMTGKERMDYIKKKALEYVTLRETWKTAIAQGPVVGELAYTTGMVRKDVLRTDRHHPFYAGSDDNQNIASLFNILTTYALNHPKVSYCQGMSDLASPLLVTMNDEAHAYICFCALMQRLCTNFMIDGIAMTQKFSHLAEGIMYYDQEFHNYLKIHQADDLLFCYRWLLLEMKREFAFEDSLRMLEVLWSSLPADPPEKELKLFDTLFQLPSVSTPPISPLVKTTRETQYTKICALRRQSSSISLSNYNYKLDANQSIKEEEERAPKTKLVKNLNEFLRIGTVSKNKISDVNIEAAIEKPKIMLTKSSFDDSESSSLDHTSENTRHYSSTSNDETFDETSPDDSQEYFPLTTSVTRELRLELENLDRTVFGDKYIERLCESPPSSEDGNTELKTVTEDFDVRENFETKRRSDDIFLWENPLHLTSPNNVVKITTHISDKQIEIENDAPSMVNETSAMKTITPIKIINQTPIEKVCSVQDEPERNSDVPNHGPFSNHIMMNGTTPTMTNSCEEVTESIKSTSLLPPPNEFGGGNPFLMFLCITLLLQHRDHIISKAMDYNEMAMHFDKMVRKHNVTRVLNQARQMYARYIKQQSMAQQRTESKIEEC
ncbi:TBC1 domain family member 25 isoform X3 [Leptinotarsa decemlineata]|uniref:TBC1 domain family member 25 isoform X3 n=1 Tax=Leptinotarsa decemlineata TaxID=7539 RepID=UPI003D307472